MPSRVMVVDLPEGAGKEMHGDEEQSAKLNDSDSSRPYVQQHCQHAVATRYSLYWHDSVMLGALVAEM